MSRGIIISTGKDYTIYRRPSGTCIKCWTCEMESYNPYDVSNKYCGNCRKFLKELDEGIFLTRGTES